MEQLQSVRRLREEVRCIRTQISEISYSPMGGAFTGMPKGSKNIRSLEAKAVKANHLWEKYFSKLSELESEEIELENALDSVPVPERLILRARYICDMEWKPISDSLGYSYVQTHRLHNKGLKILSDQERIQNQEENNE